MEFKKVDAHPMMEEKRDPMSGGLPNEKTDFRNISTLDHEDVSGPMMKPEFMYPGTDKGVNK